MGPRLSRYPRAAFEFVRDFPPRGWMDALFQLALFWCIYTGYQVVRGLSEAREAVAFANAERIIDLERALGTFFEPDLQAALLDFRWIIDIANFAYVNTQFTLTTVFIVWMYVFRNQHFYFFRNMFLAAMAIALVGYGFFPTAPPRMITEAGFVDTIAAFTSVQQDGDAASLLVNKYAAVPSMHIAFALMIAVPGFALSRLRLARGFWAAYPAFVFFVIVVTANHYWLDAAAGAMAASLAAVTAHRMARWGPERWAWPEPEPEPEPAGESAF